MSRSANPEGVAMFVRKREAKGRTYYAVVESYRDAGRIRHRQVVALGTNSDFSGAIKATKAAVRKLRRRLPQLEKLGIATPPVAREWKATAERLALQEQKLALLEKM